MAEKKRGRIPVNTKAPQASPNNRDSKVQRQVESETKDNQKDEEMNNLGPPKEPLRKLDENFETATSWKQISQDKKLLGWMIGPLPGPSEHWQNLREPRKKKVSGFLPEDLTKGKTWPIALKDGWEAIKKSFAVNNDECFGADLGELMIKSIGKMTDKRYIKGFDCLLTLSNTEALSITDSSKQDSAIFLPHSTLTELWIASITIFGSTGNSEQTQTVLKKTDKIAPVTQPWKELTSTPLEGFTSESLYQEDGLGAHDLCRKAKASHLQGQGQDKGLWAKLFLKLFKKRSQLNKDDTAVFELAKKLAMTHPQVLPGWKNNELLTNELTAAWAGAYELFGGVWDVTVKFSPKTPPRRCQDPDLSLSKQDSQVYFLPVKG
jgi:hypothetical protein